jgi:ABC-type Zn uptake system ZnuABC Zn-binding protein ZnuA
MIYHPALSYFARDYGLHQISIEEGGKEPSPAHLKELIDLCKAEDVRVIFVQPEFDKRNAETIAQQTGTKVVRINPLSPRPRQRNKQSDSDIRKANDEANYRNKKPIRRIRRPQCSP